MDFSPVWVWLKIKQEGQHAGFGPCFHGFYFGYRFFGSSSKVQRPRLHGRESSCHGPHFVLIFGATFGWSHPGSFSLTMCGEIRNFPLAHLDTWLWVKTNGILIWGRCTTHFSRDFSGWIGMFTGGTIWILTHGYFAPRRKTLC